MGVARLVTAVRARLGQLAGAGPRAALVSEDLSGLEHAHACDRALAQARARLHAFTWLGASGWSACLARTVRGSALCSRIRLGACSLRCTRWSEHDASDVLSEIDVPTLVIGGDRDPFTSRSALERLVNGIRGAEYLLLPGAGHFALLDHAQHVNLRIDKLLSERGY